MISAGLSVYKAEKNCYNIGQFMKEVTLWVVIYADLGRLFAEAT